MSDESVHNKPMLWINNEGSMVMCTEIELSWVHMSALSDP